MSRNAPTPAPAGAKPGPPPAPPLSETALSREERWRRNEQYLRRGDCLALAVDLLGNVLSTNLSTLAVGGASELSTAATRIAEDFEDWMMKPFEDESDAEDS